MRKIKFLYTLPILFAVALAGLLPMHAQQNARPSTTTVRMTVTPQVLGDNKRMPEITMEDVSVRTGNSRLQVTGWTPAREEHASLELFFLIDDAASSNLGLQLDDLRAFINAQPPTTSIGIGYMRNGTVQIVKNFTTDHNAAANALRLPMASAGAFGSPYLSVIDLMKRWPENASRREVVMITDGIDRFRRIPPYRGLGFISVDVSTASTVAQRTGTIIHTIFTRGVGRVGNNFWEITNGQNGIAKLSDETGGQSYFLGTQNVVSFRPYLDDLQKTLDNQYLLEFRITPGKKAGAQYVSLNTAVAGVELDSADSVWVKAQQ